MRVARQPAFVLHARPWRETSLLLEAFSRDHGRIGLLARGVRSARARIARATLEPFALLSMDWAGTGELPNLHAAELAAPAARPAGDALLGGFYANELLVRLTARNDPCPELFDRYGALLTELAATTSLAWTLRRFERDLLGSLGYGLQLECDAQSGQRINAEAAYIYSPEQGPLPAGARPPQDAIRGAALLALRDDVMPCAQDLPALRRMLRAAIAQHLGNHGLRSWRMLRDALRKR